MIRIIHGSDANPGTARTGGKTENPPVVSRTRKRCNINVTVLIALNVKDDGPVREKGCIHLDNNVNTVITVTVLHDPVSCKVGHANDVLVRHDGNRVRLRLNKIPALRQSPRRRNDEFDGLVAFPWRITVINDGNGNIRRALVRGDGHTRTNIVIGTSAGRTALLPDGEHNVFACRFLDLNRHGMRPGSLGNGRGGRCESHRMVIVGHRVGVRAATRIDNEAFHGRGNLHKRDGDLLVFFILFVVNEMNIDELDRVFRDCDYSA